MKRRILRAAAALMRGPGVAALLFATACASRAIPPPGSPVAAAARLSASDRGSIRFVENDYAFAIAQARAKRVPLFVDAWASWCHSCLSLRSYVFPQPILARWSERFVWLSVDTEREENASIVAKLGVRVLPTLYVIEPISETPILAWSGSLTANELAELLDDADFAFKRGEGGAAAAALLQGHRTSAEGKFDDAIRAYREALALAPSGWRKRAQAVDGLVARLADDKKLEACVVTGADEAPRLPPGTALADVVRTSIGCAEELATESPARSRLSELTTFGERIASDPAQPILADDRSDLFDYVVGGLRELGRDSDMKRVARAWAAYLEEQATTAQTPEARAVFDAHRVRAYAATGAPERALPMLAQSERDFPLDYNPPARLASVYLALERYDEALAAVKRALSRAYGPRKLRLWALEADVYEAKGDKASAQGALQAALDFARAAPLVTGYAKLRDALALRWARLR